MACCRTHWTSTKPPSPVLRRKMARTKTRYRTFATGGAVEINTPAAHIAADAATAEMMPFIDVIAPSDEASAAVQRQIDQLRNAEGVQRQQAEHAARMQEVHNVL